MPGFYDDDDDDDDFFFFLLKKNLAKALLDRACVKWLHGDAIMYGPKR